MRAAATLTSAAVRAARQLLTDLERGRRIDAAVLRGAMEAAFGASDATGAWNWKTAYDACEAATVLFLRKFGPAIRAKAGSTAAMLPMLAKIASCLPTHTRRSEDSQAFQQFSTPIPLGLAAMHRRRHYPADRVLEPSAGTGLLAIFAELAGGSLMLNELAEGRARCSIICLPPSDVTRFDAAQIDDHLDAEYRTERRPDEPAVLGCWRMSIDGWRTQLSGTSPRRSRVFATVDASSPSPAQVLRRITRRGERPLFASRNAGGSCFLPPSTVPFMPSTELRRTRGCSSSTSGPLPIRRLSRFAGHGA